METRGPRYASGAALVPAERIRRGSRPQTPPHSRLFPRIKEFTGTVESPIERDCGTIFCPNYFPILDE